MLYPHHAYVTWPDGLPRVQGRWSNDHRAVVIGRDAKASAHGEPLKPLVWCLTEEQAQAEAVYRHTQYGGQWHALPVLYLEEFGSRFHVRSPRGIVHAVTHGRRYRMGGRWFRNTRASVFGRADCHTDLTASAVHTLEPVTCRRCLAQAEREAAIPGIPPLAPCTSRKRRTHTQ